MNPLYARHKTRQIQKVVLVDFGVLERVGGVFLGKSAVVGYAHEMSSFFDETHFLSEIRNGRRDYDSILDSKCVHPVPRTFSSDISTLAKVRAIALDQIGLLRLVDRHTAVVINSPDILYTLVLPFVRIRCAFMLGYMASDPRGVARILSSESGALNRLKGAITVLNGTLISLLSDFLIVCGNLTTYRKYGEKVEESVPIATFCEMKRSDAHSVPPRSGIRILYVGGLYKNKGVDVLLSAFTKLAPDNDMGNDDLELVIAGSGGELHNLREKVKSLGLEKRVKFLGWIDCPEMLAEVYSSSSLLVVPSIITEGSPRVIDEAMYYGIPVVATDMNYGDLFSHRNNIYLVRPNSEGELANGINEVLKDEALRRKLIENGRKRIESLSAGESPAIQQARVILGKDPPRGILVGAHH